MLNTTANINHVDIIVSALKKKSKRTLYNHKALVKQALCFSPGYRDFICKIITSNSLKIISSYKSGSIIGGYSLEESNKLNKRQKSYIETDINDPHVLAHELGHAVDFWFGRNKALSRVLIIKDNQTIYDIFKEEFESKHQEIYEFIMNEYHKEVDLKVDDKAFDIMVNNIGLYQKLEQNPYDGKNPSINKRRRKIHRELEELDFIEAYYQIYTKQCYKPINDKYSPILDALSSKYDLADFFLDHHTIFYYSLGEYRPIQELFADLFAAKVTSEHAYLDNVKVILPKTFDAFERLFVIFYDHIQNNKRFTDVSIKEVQ